MKINYNIAINTNFKIEIPGAEKFNYFVQSISLPGISMSAIDTPFQGYQGYFPAYKIDYSDLTFNYIVSEDFENYMYIFKWMRDMQDSGLPRQHFKDITLHILNNNKLSNFVIVFYDCFPISNSDVTVESNIADTNGLVANASFKYRSYDVFRSAVAKDSKPKPFYIITQEKDPLVTTEDGGTAFFGVRLSTKSDFPLTLNFSVSDESLASLSVNSLIFDPDNYFQDQYITVTGLNDDPAAINLEPIEYYINITSETVDPIWTEIPVPIIRLIHMNNDAAGVIISPSTSSTSPQITTKDNTAKFTARLSFPPTDLVYVNLSSSNNNEGYISSPQSSQLVFGQLNWDVPQEFIVSGKNNEAGNGEILYEIYIATSSNDSNYNNLSNR